MSSLIKRREISNDFNRRGLYASLFVLFLAAVVLVTGGASAAEFGAWSPDIEFEIPFQDHVNRGNRVHRGGDDQGEGGYPGNNTPVLAGVEANFEEAGNSQNQFVGSKVERNAEGYTVFADHRALRYPQTSDTQVPERFQRRQIRAAQGKKFDTKRYLLAGVAVGLLCSYFAGVGLFSGRVLPKGIENSLKKALDPNTTSAMYIGCYKERDVYILNEKTPAHVTVNLPYRIRSKMLEGVRTIIKNAPEVGTSGARLSFDFELSEGAGEIGCWLVNVQMVPKGQPHGLVFGTVLNQENGAAAGSAYAYETQAPRVLLSQPQYHLPPEQTNDYSSVRPYIAKKFQAARGAQPAPGLPVYATQTSWVPPPQPQYRLPAKQTDDSPSAPPYNANEFHAATGAQPVPRLPVYAAKQMPWAPPPHPQFPSFAGKTNHSPSAPLSANEFNAAGGPWVAPDNTVYARQNTQPGLYPNPDSIL